MVAVPFPYVERPIQQRRPALVVAAGLGASHDLLWVLMITAAVNPRWPDDVEIDDHEDAGLPIPSVVRTAKIATIEARAASKLGRIQRQLSARVAAGLRRRLAPTARSQRAES
ncbi:MAG: type II toxin-antitoxin system PemK/MazF family toxin [Geminicoccaceae bacterium]